MAVPTTVRLNRTFDPERLKRDLAIAEQRFRALPQVGHYHDGHWKGIALVSLDGDHRSMLGRPQGVGIGTEVLDQCAYFREILDGLGFEVATSRLLFLHPGKKIGRHKDFDLWPQGIIRLHIPVVTNPGVHFMIDGQLMDWKEGEFWFGDFRKEHSVHNTSDVTRVHLVMDAMINEQLLALFPDEALAAIREEVDIGMYDAHVTPDPGIIDRLAGHFVIPRELISPYVPLVCRFERSGDYLDLTIPGFLFKQRFRPIAADTFEGMVFRFELGNQRSHDVTREEKSYLPFKLIRSTLKETARSTPGRPEFVITLQDGSGQEVRQLVHAHPRKRIRARALMQQVAGQGMSQAMLRGVRVVQRVRRATGVETVAPPTRA